MRDAVASGDQEFEPTLQRCAHAYVTFATTDAALLEVMFAGKHNENVDEAVALSFAPILELILRGQAEHIFEDGDPERVGLMLLSVIHGIASLRSAGMIAPDQLDWLVDDAIAQFLAARARSRPRVSMSRRRLLGLVALAPACPAFGLGPGVAGAQARTRRRPTTRSPDRRCGAGWRAARARSPPRSTTSRPARNTC